MPMKSYQFPNSLEILANFLRMTVSFGTSLTLFYVSQALRLQSKPLHTLPTYLPCLALDTLPYMYATINRHQPASLLATITLYDFVLRNFWPPFED